MKVIITGASGMVGKGVLLECLDDDRVTGVLSIGRSNTGINHAKLQELVKVDFEHPESIASNLQSYDACYFCMGVSAGGMKEADYKKITYDYTLSLAKLLVKLNPQMTFTYVSGVGTDSTEKGRSMWARVKGKTENDLLALGFKQSFMYRPGMILPLRGIKSKTKAYQFMYDYFTWLIKLIRLISPNAVVDTTSIGRSMINITEKGYHKKVITPKDILILSEAIK